SLLLVLLPSFGHAVAWPTLLSSFCCNDPATTEIYTLSLHDALPISIPHCEVIFFAGSRSASRAGRLRNDLNPRFQRLRAPLRGRSEEHTSELQSRFDLVCRLLLEKKKKTK